MQECAQGQNWLCMVQEARALLAGKVGDTDRAGEEGGLGGAKGRVTQKTWEVALVAQSWAGTLSTSADISFNSPPSASPAATAVQRSRGLPGEWFTLRNARVASRRVWSRGKSHQDGSVQLIIELHFKRTSWR